MRLRALIPLLLVTCDPQDGPGSTSNVSGGGAGAGPPVAYDSKDFTSQPTCEAPSSLVRRSCMDNTDCGKSGTCLDELCVFDPEPGTPEEALPLIDNQFAGGVIWPDEDVDVWSFEVAKPTWVTLWATTSTDDDFRPTYEFTNTTSDYFTAASGDAQGSDVLLTAPGRWFLSAKDGFGNGGDEDFDYGISLCPNPEGLVTTEAGPAIQVDVATQPVGVIFEEPGDVDTFIYHVGAGQNRLLVEAYLPEHTMSGGLLELLSSEDMVVASSSFGPQGYALFEFPFALPGSWTVRVTGPDAPGGVWVTSSAEPMVVEQEPNDTTSDANELSGAFAGALSSSSDIDVYRLNDVPEGPEEYSHNCWPQSPEDLPLSVQILPDATGVTMIVGGGGAGWYRCSLAVFIDNGGDD